MATALSARPPRAALALSLVLCLGAQAKAPAVAVDPSEQEAVGELMGDLMFHADLLDRLDTLCPPPRAGAARDWLAVLRSLPASVRTPDLRALSQRLSANAARSMVRGSGGCGTRQFAQVHAATRLEYESLLEQWARLDA